MHGQAATFMNQPHHSSARIVDEHATEAERQWGLFTHLAGLLSLGEIPFLGLIGCLILWKIKQQESPFIDDHGREAVNFQITLLIYASIGIVLGVITAGILAVPIFIGLLVLRLVGCIRGAIAAHRGEFYRYPMTFRFV